MDELSGEDWWLTEEEKAKLFWTNTKEDWWTSEDDKKRIFTKKLHDEKLAAQAIREKQKHEWDLEKIKYAQSLKEKETAAQALQERDTAIASSLLAHGLKPAELDLEYQQTIKLADITLQSLQAELNIRDEIAHREHKRDIDKVYQTAMIEITKESARILDETNKAIDINKQETLSALTKAKQQHDQTLEKDYLDHQYQMERDKLLGTIEQEDFTHKEIMRIIARLLAKKLGLHESEIAPEDLERWAAEFPL